MESLDPNDTDLQDLVTLLSGYLQQERAALKEVKTRRFRIVNGV